MFTQEEKELYYHQGGQKDEKSLRHIVSYHWGATCAVF